MLSKKCASRQNKCCFCDKKLNKCKVKLFIFLAVGFHPLSPATIQKKEVSNKGISVKLLKHRTEF